MATRKACFAVLVSAALARMPSDPTPISTSVDGLSDSTRTMHYCNLMRQARAFGTPAQPYNGNSSVDAAGWPTDDFGVILLTQGSGTPPEGAFYNGTYIVTAIGNATVSAFALNGNVVNQSYDAGRNVLTAYIDVPYNSSSDGDMWLVFTNTQRDAAAPMHSGLVNVTVLQPGCGLDMVDEFTPAFLQMLSRFDSIRFMDLLSTNNNLVANWTQRNTLLSPSFANKKGMAWESVCALGNTLQRDIWINIPAHANDDYVANLAQLLYDCVDPSLHIYYEYSNEVWNVLFEQAVYSLQVANASVLDDGDPFHFNYDGVNNVYYWAWRRTAYMCMHIADIFTTVFGAGNVGNGARVRPVLSGQGAAPIVVYTGLTYLLDIWTPPAVLLHAIAAAPYIDLGPLYFQQNMTVDQIMSALNQSTYNKSYAAGIGASNPLASNAAYAYHFGVQLRGYEGGPDTGFTHPTDLDALYSKGNASIDPRMTNVLNYYFRTWYEYGAAMGPLNYFQAGATSPYSQWGIWGILYDMRIPITPKTMGIDQTRVKPRPAPAPGARVPTLAWNATEFVGHQEPYPFPVVEFVPANTTFDYFINMPAAGSVSIVFNMSCATDGAQLQVYLGWNQTQVITVPNTGSMYVYAPTPPLVMQAPEGVSVVRLKFLLGRTYNVATLAFT